MKKSFVAKLAVAALLALGSVTQAQDEAIPAVDAPSPETAQVEAQASVSDNVSVEGEIEYVAPVSPVEDSVVYDSAVLTTGSDCVGCGQQPMVQFNSPVAAGCSSCGSAGLAYAPMNYAPTNMGCNSCSTGCPTRTTGCSACNTGCSTCNTGCSTCNTGCSACNTGCSTGNAGCSACNTGCSTGNCGAIQTASYVQPATNCGCGQIGQVSYDQPIYQQPTVSSVPMTMVSTPTSVVTGSPIVNPAPAPAVYSPSTYTPTTYGAVNQVYAPVTSGCSSCGGGTTTAYAPVQSVGTSYFNTGCDTCTSTRGRLRGRVFRNR